MIPKPSPKNPVLVPPSRIQAITFDVGGTLITPHPSVGHIYAEVAAAHGHAELSPELLNQRFAAAWKAAKDFQHTRGQWAELVDQTFFGLIEAVPSRTFFSELYERFSKAAAWRVFDEVFPVLDALRNQGVLLGIISNWDDRLRPLLRRLSLTEYFQSIVISCEVGVPKPFPAIFACAAKELSLEPQSILHVGDDFRVDYQGARAAGFNGLWLDRGRGQVDSDAVSCLRGLPGVIAQPGSKGMAILRGGH